MATENPVWLIRAKLKTKQLRAEADATGDRLRALQSETHAINNDIRPLVERRDSLDEHRIGLKGLPATDERVKHVDAQLAPVLSELAMLQEGLSDAQTRYQAAQEAAGPVFNLAARAEEALRAVQGQGFSSTQSVGGM